jgi:hypothetical protein
LDLGEVLKPDKDPYTLADPDSRNRKTLFRCNVVSWLFWEIHGALEEIIGAPNIRRAPAITLSISTGKAHTIPPVRNR